MILSLIMPVIMFSMPVINDKQDNTDEVISSIENSIRTGNLSEEMRLLAHQTLYHLYIKKADFAKAGDNMSIIAEANETCVIELDTYENIEHQPMTDNLIKIKESCKQQAYETEKTLNLLWTQINKNFGKVENQPIPDSSEDNIKTFSEFLNICEGDIVKNVITKNLKSNTKYVQFFCKNGTRDYLIFLND